jgi:hypothetical protein
MPRVEISEAAAPASKTVEKFRLFIIMVSLLGYTSWRWSNLMAAQSVLCSRASTFAERAMVPTCTKAS